MKNGRQLTTKGSINPGLKDLRKETIKIVATTEYV